MQKQRELFGNMWCGRNVISKIECDTDKFSICLYFFLTDFNSSINASEREGDLLIRERTQSES